MRNPFLILMLGFMLTFTHPGDSHATSAWRVPVDKPELVNQYRQPNSDYSAGHRGVDYLVTEGQAVFAPSDGEVKFVGKVVDRAVLSIQHGKSLSTTLEPVCSHLSKGEDVATGDLIGHICFEPGYVSHCGVRKCLHFALKTELGYLSPLVTIGGLTPSRLLPIKP